MAREKIGIGLVGCGTIAPHHLEAIANIEDAELVATMDIIPERARDMAEKYGAKSWYSNLDDFLGDKRIKLVNVATPSGVHAAPAIAAARAGKHVIVEKPIALTLQQADEMIATAKAAGVKLASIFQHRFSPGASLLKQQIDAGRFGRMVVGNAYIKWYRTQAYYDAGGWRGTWAMDGGAVLSNQSIHTIDLLQLMMGPAKTVFGMIATRTHKMETEDLGIAVIRFESGALGTIEGSTCIYPGPIENAKTLYPGFPSLLEIFGEKGSVQLEEKGQIRMWKFADNPGEEAEILQRYYKPDQPPYVGRFRDAETSYGHNKQIRDMIQAIQDDREPRVTGEAARKSLELMRAVYYSALSGKPVNLPLTVRDETPYPTVSTL